jgi:NAD(P)-dependent dehydrogenase (short-subunit alcohol dehydrogenase family)
MDGQTVIITGAAAGIGRALALELARRGAHVVVSARTDAAAAPVLDEITRAGGKAESLPMDVASPDSIRAAVTRFLDSHGKLDVLVNNAGVWAGKRTVTPEGFETTWSVNVLAPFRLAQLLDGALKAGAGKVINLSSVQHYKGDIHWDDLQLERAYHGAKAYRQSKLALTMLSLEHAARDAALKVNAVHPGVAGTALFRNFPAFIRFWINLLMSTPEKCAKPPLQLAADPAHHDVSGRFYHQLRPRDPHPMASDEAARKRLWDLVSGQSGV